MSDPSVPPSTVPHERPILLGLSRGELRERLGPLVDRPFRVEQIYDALHRRGVRRFAEITELSRSLRAALESRFRIGMPFIEERRVSRDETAKYLLRLDDGASIEAVDIPEPGRRTLCISSQAGCALGCRFCVTGFWGAGRDLTAGEIVGQVLAIRHQWGEEIPARLNLVFMGMGEPLLNLGAVERSLEILGEVLLSWRRMTVSTAGVIPGIETMGRWEKRPNLAISLHAPDDERRSALMPINRTYPLADLMESLRRYPLEKGRRITFEYLLIRGFNDRSSDAAALGRLLAGLRAKVNLIPVNPDPVLGDDMVPPSDEVVGGFQAILRRRGLVATVRRRRGDEVSGACGQLRAFGRSPRGVRARRSEAAREATTPAPLKGGKPLAR